MRVPLASDGSKVATVATPVGLAPEVGDGLAHDEDVARVPEQAPAHEVLPQHPERVRLREPGQPVRDEGGVVLAAPQHVPPQKRVTPAASGRRVV